MDINITINTGEKPEVKIKEPPLVKKKTRKLKNGREQVLELPNMTRMSDNTNILDLVGIGAT